MGYHKHVAAVLIFSLLVSLLSTRAAVSISVFSLFLIYPSIAVTVRRLKAFGPTHMLFFSDLPNLEFPPREMIAELMLWPARGPTGESNPDPKSGGSWSKS
jgi:hypothetical protein